MVNGIDKSRAAFQQAAQDRARSPRPVPQNMPDSPEPELKTPGDLGNLSTIAATYVPNAKATKEKLIIGGWPTMRGFNPWRLSFKKAVANASNRNPDDAFKWITAVETANTMEELSDSGAFPELDILLALEWERIVHGEFKSRVRSIEFELERVGKLIKGRQTTWLVYHHFRLSETDSAMNAWHLFMNVTLVGDNLQ